VRYTVESGALVLPVLQTLEWFRGQAAPLGPSVSFPTL
jgi:hypothetical protein